MSLMPLRRSAPPGPLALTLDDERATGALGAALARALAPGDAVLLSGPLGAGKSALARATIRARLRDPAAEVPSPSYTLVNVYPDPRAPEGDGIWHADLYRLSDPEETAELGLAEAFATAIVLVEWPERLGDALPPRRLEIALAPGGETVRHLRIAPVGPGWDALMAELAA